MTTYTVNTAADPCAPHTAGRLSLRAAIALANASDRPTTIRFDPSLKGQAIVLTAGTLRIQSPLTIAGLGANELSILRDHAAPEFRLFTVKGTAAADPIFAVHIDGLTLTGGISASGGGLYNDSAELTISNCCVFDNATQQLHQKGGALYNRVGYVYIRNTRILHNISGLGGGIYNEDGTIQLYKSRLSDNTATYGGGLYNYGENATVVAIKSSLLDNMAYLGSDLRNLRGTIKLEDSVISGDQALARSGQPRQTLALTAAA